MSAIPLSRPPVGRSDQDRPCSPPSTLASTSSGPECRSFEAELAAYVGVRHAVLTSSATAGLWLTLRALGVKAGDEILVPAHTALSHHRGDRAAPRPRRCSWTSTRYYGLDPADAAAKATPRTVGLMPVHLYGQPVDLDAVRRAGSPAWASGCWRICAQAHGAAWHRRQVGGFGRARRVLVLSLQEPHRDG